MLDTGSGVNSTTEELVVALMKENSAAGITLSDPRHPIKKFGKWEHEESLVGVAGSAKVRLLGTVVVRVGFIPVGDKKEKGPEVLIRFKICEKGTTDWVGWIIGARALDCQERGGLGFSAQNHSHNFATLGVACERKGEEKAVLTNATLRKQRRYASRVSIPMTMVNSGCRCLSLGVHRCLESRKNLFVRRRAFRRVL